MFKKKVLTSVTQTLSTSLTLVHKIQIFLADLTYKETKHRHTENKILHKIKQAYGHAYKITFTIWTCCCYRSHVNLWLKPATRY